MRREMHAAMIDDDDRGDGKVRRSNLVDVIW